MGELMNQICALQHPLDSATEALDQQAKDERYQYLMVATNCTTQQSHIS